MWTISKQTVTVQEYCPAKPEYFQCFPVLTGFRVPSVLPAPSSLNEHASLHSSASSHLLYADSLPYNSKARSNSLKSAVCLSTKVSLLKKLFCKGSSCFRNLFFFLVDVASQKKVFVTTIQPHTPNLLSPLFRD